MKRLLSKFSTKTSLFSRRAFLKSLLGTAGGALVVSSFWVVRRAKGRHRMPRDVCLNNTEKEEIIENPPDDLLIIENLGTSHIWAG